MLERNKRYSWRCCAGGAWAGCSQVAAGPHAVDDGARVRQQLLDAGLLSRVWHAARGLVHALQVGLQGLDLQPCAGAGGSVAGVSLDAAAAAGGRCRCCSQRCWPRAPRLPGRPALPQAAWRTCSLVGSEHGCGRAHGGTDWALAAVAGRPSAAICCCHLLIARRTISPAAPRSPAR